MGCKNLIMALKRWTIDCKFEINSTRFNTLSISVSMHEEKTIFMHIIHFISLYQRSPFGEIGAKPPNFCVIPFCASVFMPITNFTLWVRCDADLSFEFLSIRANKVEFFLKNSTNTCWYVVVEEKEHICHPHGKLIINWLSTVKTIAGVGVHEAN